MQNREKPTIIHAGWSGFWITIGLWSIFSGVIPISEPP